MSLPVSLYPTTWTYGPTPDVGDNVANRAGFVYPYGVDPKWYHTKNQLTFFNATKMKTAVLIGGTHMSFGIILSLFNHVHFNDKLGVFFEFIPQLTFMLCTFGYMCCLIIIKWCTDWTRTTQEPPNLIQTMIQMFLGLGKISEEKQLYHGQSTVQGVLLAFAFISIPFMFCAKPCILSQCPPGGHNGHGNGGSNGNGASTSSAVVEAHDEKHQAMDEKGEPVPLSASAAAAQQQAAKAEGGEEHTFGDYMIHQSIHTIEFILGTVSNTASYLRLWALSLAHSELADVFWTKLILEYGLYKNSGFFSMISVAVWLVMTIGVLLCMDVLECFLHALRLHWVEFQNKFFHADGYAFAPFSYKAAEES